MPHLRYPGTLLQELQALQNRKYSLEQNKRYYQKKHKGQTDDVKAGDSRPTEGGGSTGGSGRPSGGGQGRRKRNASNSNSTSSSEPPTEQARYARELDLTDARDANLDVEEMSLVCKCSHDVIDLLLDTGTVSNLVPEEHRDVVQDILS